ncbi:hypothetical protein Sjap_012238 [Stephania japonica]|uniref:Uncharacterized protein n=1 Tax=Stephania japonica TaxID=461633 RepID=A0AAP0P052_9MAGN
MNSSTPKTSQMANIFLSTTLISLYTITTLLIAAHAAVDVAANVTEPLETSSRPTLPEVLIQYGLPSGIFPETVKSYTLSHNGELEVEIDPTCCIIFFGIIYHSKITGKLSYGEITDVSGMEIMGDTLIWMNVIGIKLVSNTVEFRVKVAFLSKRYPASSFTDYFPTCTVNAYRCFIVPRGLQSDRVSVAANLSDDM